MRRLVPYLACVAGIVVVLALLPRFNAAQPRGIRLTSGDSIPIADRAARQLVELIAASIERPLAAVRPSLAARRATTFDIATAI